MALTLNLSNIKDVNKVRAPGFNESPPGRGMVIFRGLREHVAGKQGGLRHEAVFEISEWTDQSPGVKGHEHVEMIFLDKQTGMPTDATFAKLTRLAIALGLITPVQAEQIKSGTGAVEMDFDHAKGRPLYMEIVRRPDKNDPSKTYVGVADFGCAYFHIGDPECADPQQWPRNQGVLNRSGAQCGVWQPVAAPSPSQPVAATAGSSNPPPAAFNPFAGR